MPEAQRGRVLLDIARDAIADPSGDRGPQAWKEAWLREPGATFVTLRDASGGLRGCIGTVDAHRGLGDDVAHNARAAAYRDPRFAPLDARERASVGIEVSVLTPRVALPASSEADALAKLVPGEDGLVFEFRDRHATFLPQVWESLPDPFDFFSELRRKAGVPARFWHDDVRLWRYRVEKYS